MSPQEEALDLYRKMQSSVQQKDAQEFDLLVHAAKLRQGRRHLAAAPGFGTSFKKKKYEAVGRGARGLLRASCLRHCNKSRERIDLTSPGPYSAISMSRVSLSAVRSATGAQ